MQYGPNTTYLRAFERAYDDRTTRLLERALSVFRRRSVVLSLAALPALLAGLWLTWPMAIIAAAGGLTFAYGAAHLLTHWLDRRARRASAVAVRAARDD